MQVNEVVKLHRKVLTEIARQTMEDRLDKDVEQILYNVVTDGGPRYRCCIHKERAVLRNRITLALGRDVDESIEEAAEKSLRSDVLKAEPILKVLPEACDQCPIDKFIVTDGCRNCIAHNCIGVCPKRAITIHQNRAYIDKEKCVECGMCKKVCPFGAIIEISRPCERSCAVKAISAASDRRAVIDSEKCVECGACKVACPFGAVADRSFIVPLIQDMKAKKPVFAMVAPAFVGQFGAKVTAKQVFQAMKKLGFTGVYEVALGADMVTLAEAEEFLETVPSERNYMTTSCCPAFADLIRKHMPNVLPHMSSTTSPMVATAEVVKKNHPEAVTVFVGPCAAKKSEAKRYPDLIDYVITYEELASMMVGAGINVSEIEEGEVEFLGSRHGSIFGRAGGVLEAVAETIKEIDPNAEVKGEKCDGLANCRTMLMQIAAGRLDVNIMEGMACMGGCVGGPGTIMDSRVTGKMIDNFAKTVPHNTSKANQLAQDELKAVDMHRK